MTFEQQTLPNDTIPSDANMSSVGHLCRQQPRRILVLSAPFPSVAEPTYGVFVKERVKAVAALPGYEVRVIAPVPYFPPIKAFSRWYRWSQFPREEMIDGLKVYRPRYLLPPKVGGYFHPSLMYRAVRRIADRLRKTFDFDLIDAHFVYPAGVVGAMLGERYQKPVVITGRGEDMLRFPKLPIVGRSIRYALQQSSQLVALSQEIADAMAANGAAREKITIIPNGVDTEKFIPILQVEAREKLGLPTNRPIVISVGDRQERKGFHLLVDALPEIRRQHPNVLLVIVGGSPRSGRDFTPDIEQRIHTQGLEDHVKLVGRRPHEELPLWYNAADLFALLSSREGSPNVLLEALACGTPAVATPVGGIREVLEDERLGVLLAERSMESAAVGVRDALGKNWDSTAIRQILDGRSWTATAREVLPLFEQVLARRPATVS